MKTLFLMKFAILAAVIVLFATAQTLAQKDLWCMEFADNLNGITLGDNGIIKQTTDGGLSWTMKLSGTSNTLKKTVLLNVDNIIMVAGFSGTILETKDNGDTWTIKPTGVTSDLYGISFGGRNSAIGVAVGDNGTIIRTTDKGESWGQISARSFTTIKPRLTAVSFASENKAIIVGEKGVLLITNDGGLSWYRCSSNVPNITYKSVIMLSEDVAYATGDAGTIIKTTDGGQSWISLNTNSNASLTRIRFADDQIAISVGSNGQVIKTTDGGTTWGNETSGTTNNLNCLFVVDDSLAYTGGQNGIILKTTDGGLTWSAGGSPNNLMFAKNETTIKMSAYPNPSNPVTTIKYFIPSQSLVTLKIYDSVGREVKTLLNQVLTTGLYSSIFDGTNLSSGMYYCRLIASSNSGTFNQTMKITLVK